MKKILQPVSLPHWSIDILMALPRIICGYLLTAQFGASKFGLPWSPPEKHLGFFQVVDWFPEDVSHYGGLFALAPGFFAWMGAFAEAVGGLFLMFGLLTRPFAFLLVITMLVAVVFQQWDEGVWNMLPALGFLWVSLYALIFGSGKAGVDHWIAQRLR